MSPKCKNQCNTDIIEVLKRENAELKQQVDTLNNVLSNIKALLKTKITQARATFKAHKL